MNSLKATVKRAVLASGVVVLALGFASCRVRPEGTGPAGLAESEIPQFVSFSSDDNGFSGLPGSGSEGGLHYLTGLFGAKRNPAGSGDPRTFDGTVPHYTFFVVTQYIAPETAGLGTGEYGRGDNPVFLKRAWGEAVDRGHEIGVHTHSHPHGRPLSVDQWDEEMKLAIEALARPRDPAETPERPNPASGLGLPRSALPGFRAPYLEWSDAGLAAAYRRGFVYDSSLEDGPALGPHRGEFAWPYALDEGLPGHLPPVGRYPGFREVPLLNFVAPPDDACPRYGIPAGFRAALKERQSYFNPGNGEITGMDWNLWYEFLMSPAEAVATLKYTYDLHLSRGRSPMTVGLHSEIYTVKSDGTTDAAEVRARRAALEAFLEYVLSKPETRLVSQRELLAWIDDPVPLRSPGRR